MPALLSCDVHFDGQIAREYVLRKCEKRRDLFSF